MMDKLYDKLALLTVMEYNEAAKNYGKLFNSLHEGFGVLLEEVVEASENMIRLEENAMEELFCAIRADDPERAKTATTMVEFAAMHLACEAIQVAAMARKMQKTIESN